MKLTGKKVTRVETNLGTVLNVTGQALIITGLIVNKLATRQAQQKKAA